MSFRKEILEAVERAIDHFGLTVSRYTVEHPADEAYGDYATNIAMVARESVVEVGEKSLSPRELAMKVTDFFEKDERLSDLVEKMEVAGPGFINFFIKKEKLFEELGKVVEEKSDYGRGEWGKGKRVVVDYSSPNIAKRFGVSHMRSTLIGRAMVNLYRFSGFEVIGDNHLGDWGTQFGMIIAAVEEKNLEIGQMTIEDLERIYVSYNQRIETEPELQEKAREAFARLEKGEEKARKIWQEAMKISLLEFEKVYEQLGVKIEKAYGESFYEDKMAKVIEEAKQKSLVRESEGALIMEFEKLPPAMLVKSNGTTTYFTRDLATVWFRLFGDDSDMRADLYIYEVGSGQTLHFKQLFEVVEKLGWINKDRLVHVAHGWMRLPEGKMSTRKGNLVNMGELLEEAVDKAVELADGEMEIAKKVGVGAVIYNELKHAPETDYVFLLEEAMNMEGDSGPYLQYSVVRGRAVLAKAKNDIDHLTFNIDYFGEEERRILRYLYRLSEVVEVAARTFSPNLVCSYLFELASRFNRFYNKEKIIGSDKEKERLLLTMAVVQVLENGLGVLGVEVPERM
jgi:arginyl-tRNA synthetase